MGMIHKLPTWFSMASYSQLVVRVTDHESDPMEGDAFLRVRVEQ